MGRSRRCRMGLVAALALCLVCSQAVPSAESSSALVDAVIGVQDVAEAAALVPLDLPVLGAPVARIPRGDGAPPLYRADLVRARRWGS